MYTLVRSYCSTKGIPIRILFRKAYQWENGKNLPESTLEEDVRTFNETFDTPEYVCEYIARLYGT